MCCGKANVPNQTLSFSVSEPDPIEGYVGLRYIGTSGGGSTWSAPSKTNYRIGAAGSLFYAKPDDVAWFLTRMERGKPIFAIVETPTPVVEITPVIEPLVIETPIDEELPFSIEPEQIELIEVVEEKPVKRSRKKAE